MGYLHIENLYRPYAQRILSLRECYVLEKIHGTSAHISYTAGALTFSSGGESHARFVGLFDQQKLLAGFETLGHARVTVYGEAYGGKQQGMSGTYGKDLQFIVFDVQVGDSWLSVPEADAVTITLGLEFVPYELNDATLEVLDRERDRPSIVAARRGMGTDKRREGIVIRPTFEITMNGGHRLIVKHKQEAFSERATPQKVVTAEKLTVLAEATAIADEWVTPMRLTHVLGKLPGLVDVTKTKQVIEAMIGDVYREASGEIVESREAKAAISRRTAELFKERMKTEA